MPNWPRRLQREAAEREKREAAQRQEDEKKQRADAERQRLIAEREAREAEQRRQVEAERQRLAAERERQEAEKAAKEMRPGKVFKDCADCPEMVVIPAGSFEMGSNENFIGNAEWDKRYKPVHSVRIGKAFALATTELTRGQFASFVSSSGYDAGNSCWIWTGSKLEDTAGRSWRNPGFSQSDADPVACVNWNDAQAYVQWLAQKSGKSYRLPSEAEWEYSCRAGGTNAYCGSDSVDSVAWYGALANPKGNSGSNTNRVATKQPNAWGLYDMSGNVWEWTQDCFNETYSGAPTDGAAWSSGNCGQRVRRGGSWFDRPQLTRSANRNGFVATIRYGSLGFRLARMLP
jgi:formylglycine-generating enzyme required for sulfatase activity